MTTRLDHFETGLLMALREHVADRPSATSNAEVLVPRVRAPKRPLVRGLLGGVAITLVAAAAVVVVPGLGSTAAYSVQEGNAGRIEVEVHRFEDSAGLERALADHGIDAQITYIPNGGACAPARYTSIERGGISLSMGAELFRITLEPGSVRDGETLVVDASLVRLPDSVDRDSGIKNTDGIRVAVDFGVTDGPVPPCTPIPATGAGA